MTELPAKESPDSMENVESVPQPPSRPWPRSRMLNVWVDNLSMKQLMATLDSGIVFTLNPDHLYHLQRHRGFYDAYRQADFITSDSKYVYWGLGWIGRRIQEKVSGSDIVPAYCAHHRDNPDVKVFLLGAAPGIAQKALESINARVGRDIVVKAHSPSMNFVNDPNEIADTIRLINDSGATCLILAPEHPLAQKLLDDAGRAKARQMIDARKQMGPGDIVKDGAFTGHYAINP